MLHYLPELLTVAVIHLLALSTPGPDFLIVVKHADCGSRKLGLWTALGVALGMPVHIIYSLLGIGYIIAQSIVLFSAIKFISAGYLLYIGIHALTSKPNKNDGSQPLQTDFAITPAAALRSGFLTNVLNPKATLFFLALFTQVIGPTTPLNIRVFYGLEMTLVTLAWFSLVAALLSHPVVQNKFIGLRHHLDRAFGVLLIALGIKIAFSTKK